MSCLLPFERFGILSSSPAPEHGDYGYGYKKSVVPYLLSVPTSWGLRIACLLRNKTTQRTTRICKKSSEANTPRMGIRHRAWCDYISMRHLPLLLFCKRLFRKLRSSKTSELKRQVNAIRMYFRIWFNTRHCKFRHYFYCVKQYPIFFAKFAGATSALSLRCLCVADAKLTIITDFSWNLFVHSVHISI